MSSGLQSRYGSWAVVTGASAGIGRALAVELASGGLNVVLVARREDRLTALSSQLASAHGVSCRVVALDLIAADAIDRLTSATADLDVGLVAHAAGVGVGGPHFDARVERHHRMLALNCGAALDLLSAYLPAMKARGRGGFVLFGSVVGFTGVPWAAHYSATKAWIHSLGEALQVELRGTGVDVSVVAPGPTTSEFASQSGINAGGATPEQVARGVVRNLGRGGIRLTDRLARLIKLSHFGSPRWLVVRIMGRVMQGMTANAHPALETREPQPHEVR